jgi:hypothetical protein
MSTSGVSTSSLSQQLQSYFETRKNDLQQLGQALQSGNLADAQVAYNNLVTLAQGGPSSSGNVFRGSQRQQEFAAVGQALQSGDLAGAAQAFAALTSSQGARGLNAPPGAGASLNGSGPEIILNLSNSSAGSSPEQITINIGNSGNGGSEQVSLSVGNQQGSNAQEITFNLNPNSNEQIVINLLDGSASSGANSSSAGSTGTSGGGGISISA